MKKLFTLLFEVISKILKNKNLLDLSDSWETFDNSIEFIFYFHEISSELFVT